MTPVREIDTGTLIEISVSAQYKREQKEGARSIVLVGEEIVRKGGEGGGGGWGEEEGRVNYCVPKGPPKSLPVIISCQETGHYLSHSHKRPSL